MHRPRNREIEFKRYGLYTCGVVCGYLMIFIVGPFFISMGIILVITGALFGLQQILSGGWIFMIIGITTFILGLIIPKVCGAVLSKMFVRDVTDIVKENEPALTEAAAVWTEEFNNQMRQQGALRQRQLLGPGLSPFQAQPDIFRRNMNVMNDPSSDQWFAELLVRDSQNAAASRPGAAVFPEPPPYPGQQQQQQQQQQPPTPPPPYPTAAAV